MANGVDRPHSVSLESHVTCRFRVLLAPDAIRARNAAKHRAFQRRWANFLRDGGQRRRSKMWAVDWNRTITTSWGNWRKPLFDAREQTSSFVNDFVCGINARAERNGPS